MTYSDLDQKYKQLEDLSGFVDIYKKIEDIIYNQANKENRDLNDDEKEWLDDNMPF